MTENLQTRSTRNNSLTIGLICLSNRVWTIDLENGEDIGCRISRFDPLLDPLVAQLLVLLVRCLEEDYGVLVAAL